MMKNIDGVQHTHDSIVEQYERLVYKYANKLSRHNADDLAQEGFIGLLDAFDRFDESRGYKFITYATSYVYGYMLRYHNAQTVIRFSTNVIETAWRIQKLELWDQTDEEIAKEINVTTHYVEGARKYFASRQSTSMDKTIDEDDKSTLYDIRGSKEDYSGIHVEEFLKVLNSRDRMIVHQLQLGKKNVEIAKEMGVSKSYISYLVKGIRKKYLEAMV